MTDALPKRQDVPRDRLWNIENVYPSQDAWEDAFASLEASIPTIEKYANRLSESAGILWEAMEALMEASVLKWRVSLYAGMLRAGDAGDQEAASLVGRATALGSRFGSAAAFFDPELLSIDEATLERFFEDEPKLARYRHHFDSLRRVKSHVRSKEIEEVLAGVGPLRSGPSQLYRNLVDSELKFADAVGSDGVTRKVEQGSIGELLEQPDRLLRQSAWESYADGYLSVKNTLASALTQSMQGYVFSARARNYESVLASRMEPNAIPRAVFDNLIATFVANLPTWHRYWRALQKSLGVSSLHVFDTPLTHGPSSVTSQRRKIAWDDAVTMVCDGMAPLGGEYVDVMRRGLTSERWVDAWPNQGKGSGAFSSGAPGTHPFIMMNYACDINSVSTLAHELGHSMHSYLSWQNQPYVYSGYSLFAAETASNFNQAMVRAHLLRTSDDDFRLQVLEEAFSNFFRYLFVMPTLARLELECYTALENGQALTADALSGKVCALFTEAFGPSVTIDADRVGVTWAQFGHLYSSYYVYQYATGISAANALAQQVLAEGEPAAARYLDFLKAGGSAYPLDALKRAGIDMTTAAPLQAGFDVLKGLVDQYEELVG